jgi:hypothetical protein
MAKASPTSAAATQPAGRPTIRKVAMLNILEPLADT